MKATESFSTLSGFTIFLAIRTEQGAGIAKQTLDADVLGTVEAAAVSILVKALTRRLQLDQSIPGTTVGGVGKRLLLQGIHSGQTTDSALIEFDVAAGLPAHLDAALEALSKSLQLVA